MAIAAILLLSCEGSPPHGCAKVIGAGIAALPLDVCASIPLRDDLANRIMDLGLLRSYC